MTSLTWIKRITGIGLSLMSPDVQKERMNRVFDGDRINGPALAKLIDECKTAADLFLEKHSSDEEQKNMIKEILKQTDGKSIVANIAGDQDITWLLELKEKVLGFGLSVKDLKEL